MLDLARLTTALADRYRIEREIGSGGMATVYLAEDLQRHRMVALKIVRPDIASTIGTERFLREIQVTSHLTHPNIMPLYDSGVCPPTGSGSLSGLPWFTMPFVEGESLRSRLARESQLPLEDALRIASEVADALSYAHGHDIVHRDIKPENILFEAGHAVVADFGIAKALTASAKPVESSGSVPIGTPPYMSPEQLAGERGLDGRSDLYSLGCVVYEMLAGQPPFTGRTSESIARQHLAAPVPAVRVVRPNVPPEVDAAIRRALAKAPADRFSSASDFRDALMHGTASSRPVASRLRRALPAALVAVTAVIGLSIVLIANRSKRDRNAVLASEPPPRIALLYFEVHPPDSSLQLFADGLTEDLIRELGSLSAFRVISRTGVRPYRDRHVAFDSIVAALGVTMVIDGSVRRIGDTLQVRADLIDAASRTNVDSVSLTRLGSALASREREMASQVATELRRRMGRALRSRENVAGTSSPIARDLVLEARRARDDGAALMAEPLADLAGARAAFERADSLLALAARADPDWLRPVIDRGWVAEERARTLSDTGRVAALESALPLAGEAVRREPQSAEALQLRGTVRWELVTELVTSPLDTIGLNEAEADLRAAVDRDSTLAAGWATLSFLLWVKGDLRESALAAQSALREDAYLADAEQVFLQAFFSSLFMSDFKQAGEWCRRGRLSSPDDWRFFECELTLLRYDRRKRPDPDSAWALVATLERLDPPARAAAEGRTYHTIYRRVVAGTISAQAGDRDVGRAELARALRATAKDSSLRLDLAYDQAYLRLVLGQRREAEQLLRALIAARPLLGPPLAKDPLFEELLRTERTTGVRSVPEQP